MVKADIIPLKTAIDSNNFDAFYECIKSCDISLNSIMLEPRCNIVKYITMRTQTTNRFRMAKFAIDNGVIFNKHGLFNALNNMPEIVFYCCKKGMLNYLPEMLHYVLDKPDLVYELIQNCNLNIDESDFRNSSNWTPLEVCVKNKYYDSIEYLLKAGANMNASGMFDKPLIDWVNDDMNDYVIQDLFSREEFFRKTN